MEQIPAAMDRHLEVIQCHQEAGILLGASSLTGRYWYGSLWYYQTPADAPHVEKCTAGVQLEAGLGDACWIGSSQVLVGMDTGGIALWELTDSHHTFIQQSSTTEHDDIVSSVSVCQGEKTAVSASWDRSVKIWDLETLTSIHTYTAHSDAVLCVHCHSQEPSLFLSASLDGTVCLWDTRNSKPVTRLLNNAPLQCTPTCVAWQPDTGHTYAMGSDSGQLVVRDTRSAVTEAFSYTPHHRPVTQLCFNTDKTNLFATVSEDCSVIVSEICSEELKQIYRDTSHRDYVRAASWTKDCQLFTCSWDSTVRTHTGIKTEDQGALGDSEQSHMEVNGEVSAKSVDKSEAKCSEKPTVNGDNVNPENTSVEVAS